jgi:hypothetical protein
MQMYQFLKSILLTVFIVIPIVSITSETPSYFERIGLGNLLTILMGVGVFLAILAFALAKPIQGE